MNNFKIFLTSFDVIIDSVSINSWRRVKRNEEIIIPNCYFYLFVKFEPKCRSFAGLARQRVRQNDAQTLGRCRVLQKALQVKTRGLIQTRGFIMST